MTKIADSGRLGRIRVGLHMNVYSICRQEKKSFVRERILLIVRLADGKCGAAPRIRSLSRRTDQKGCRHEGRPHHRSVPGKRTTLSSTDRVRAMLSLDRSEERSVGQECVSTGRTR